MTAVEPLSKHPAKYSDTIIPVLRGMVRVEADRLQRRPRVLDPFAGVGRIHLLEDVSATTGVEIEPRWAACHPRTLCGNALRLHWRWTGRFDVVATSPCYGNRFADHHDAQDGSTRRSYTHDYGETLHPENAGTLHFGPKYQRFHVRAWRQVLRVLVDDGLFLLNVSNFQRQKAEVDVAGWHRDTLRELGFRFVGEVPVTTRRMRFGENHEARVGHELVLAFRRPVR